MPAMIRFACGTCKERLVVPAHHAGRRGKCPNCGTVNRVPARSENARAGNGIAPEPGSVIAPALAPPAGVALPQQAAETFGGEPRVEADPQVESGPSDPSARLVEVNLLDDAGMPVWLKLLIVVGILGVLVLGVWVVFYLLIWSHLKLSG